MVLLSQLPVGLHRRVTLEKLEKLETWSISAGFKCENTWNNKWKNTSKTVLPLNIEMGASRHRLRDLRLTGITSHTQDFIVVVGFQIGSLRFLGRWPAAHWYHPKWKQTKSKDKPVDEYKSTDWVPEIIWNLMLKHTRISALAEYQARDMKLSPDRTPVYY